MCVVQFINIFRRYDCALYEAVFESNLAWTLQRGLQHVTCTSIQEACVYVHRNYRKSGVCYTIYWCT